MQTMMLDQALDMMVHSLHVGNMVNSTQALILDTVCKEALILADCANTLAVELIPINTEGDYLTDAERCINRGIEQRRRGGEDAC